MLKSWWGGNIKMVICDVVFNCVSLSYGKLNSSLAGPSPPGIFRLRLLSRKQQQQKNNRKTTSSVTLGEPKELPNMVSITYELAGELKLSFCHQVP